jgi:hypothetical protein
MRYKFFAFIGVLVYVIDKPRSEMSILNLGLATMVWNVHREYSIGFLWIFLSVFSTGFETMFYDFTRIHNNS